MSKHHNRLYVLEKVVTSCWQCPNRRVDSRGRAAEVFCTATPKDRLIQGYVEWDSDIKEIPSWCPLPTTEKSP